MVNVTTINNGVTLKRLVINNLLPVIDVNINPSHGEPCENY